MSDNFISEQILNGVIEGHRQLISDRYEYDRVKAKYDLPFTFTEDKAVELRDFFMHHVYPSVEQRVELNEAFNHLDAFLKSPNKIFRILADSVGIMFKYGRQLPKFLTAAIKAFQSFRSASKIENLLAQKAIQHNAIPPYSQEHIKGFMSDIPDETLEDHIASITPLYDILMDRKLVKKILAVVEDLIARMEKHTGVYNTNEIEGIRIGRNLIAEAVRLFEDFSQSQLEHLFAEISKIEHDAYAEFLRE